ncbi:MAG: polysaccharide pyruvyl transferase CsaB [Clostridia bacterium]|nr:polysaccharide pyruvyl transferase CsaB [Clostridia bacterium]
MISGFYGFDNAGDEAILQSMVSEFRKAYSDVDIVVLSANPSKTASLYQVKSVNRSNLIQVISAIKNSDMLISGGGGLFQDVTSTFSMWYYSGIILIAFALKKPVFAFAQGIGPVRNWVNRKLLKYLSNRVHGISVRDRWSQKELENIGVKRTVSCTVDPAFLIEPLPKCECIKLLCNESSGISLERPKIGFSLRSWKGDTDVAGIFAEVADKASRELGADIFFFPLHYKKDIVLAEDIVGRMKEKAVILRGNYSPREIIGLYGLMDMNVSIRLHGLVFSLMNRIPMLAISYDPKIDHFMNFLGMNEFLRYNSLSSDLVFNTLKEKWDNRKEHTLEISLKSEDVKLLAAKGVKELVDTLNKIGKSNS